MLAEPSDAVTSTRPSAGPSPTTAVPTVPGYDLLESIGEGGMGIVWKARQTKLNRLVALKMMLGEERAGSKGLIRFLAEAEAVAAVKHPHVVQVYDYGEAGGRPFLAMEYLSGGSLADQLKQTGRLDPKAAAELVATLAGAVQAAHDLGIVHRDLKPGNVLFDERRQPKVTDFGLAKRARGNDLTQTGVVMGTPAYMSPEQAKGKTKFVGPQADVYALGVILYECLTGAIPFGGADIHLMLRQIVEDDPKPPSKLVPGLDRDLELIVLKCLAKEPFDRYQSARHVASDLAHFVAGEPVSVREVGTLERAMKWARRKPVLAAAYALMAAVVVLLAFGAGVALLWRRAESARAEAEVALKGETKARADADNARAQVEIARAQVELARENLARAEYGRTVQIAHQEWRDRNRTATLALLGGTREDLRGWEWNYLQRLCQPKTLELKGQPARLVSWSPDGRRLATAVGSTVRIWNATTGITVLELKNDDMYLVDAVSWSPDGRQGVVVGQDKSSRGMARVWNMKDGTPAFTIRDVRYLKYERNNWAAGAVAWSPDSRRLATTVRDTVSVWDAKTGSATLVLKGHSRDVMAVGLSPDGSRFATLSTDSTVRVWDVRSGREILKLQRGLDVFSVNSLAWSPDGTHIALTGTGAPNTVRVWDARSGAVTFVLKGHTDMVNSVAWSTDGARIATASDDQTARVWDAKTGAAVLMLRGHGSYVSLALWNADGSRLATMGTEATARVWDARTGAETRGFEGPIGSSVSSLAWNPDGTRIAIASGGSARISDLVLPDETLAIKGHADALNSICWSPDGTRVATASADRTARVWNAESGAEVLTLKLHTDVVTGVAWSPDGTRLATSSADRSVRLWNAETGHHLQMIQDSGNHVYAMDTVAWSPDSKRVAAITGQGIWVWSAQSGQPIRMKLRNYTGGGSAVSWSPDGLSFAVCSKEMGNVIGEIWELRTGEIKVRLEGPKALQDAVAWSRDGSRLATCSRDRTARIWDSQTGGVLAALRGHTGYVSAVSWSPDGSRVATASVDNTARVWDARSGAEVLTLKCHTNKVTSVAWSPDGSRIATASGDGVARIWDARISGGRPSP
jgi:WD40 repeat protein/tRNA A-37 threonylcarbamoyl transferase component Bud32